MVALVDTNCNPQNIDYVIPSNDDAIRAIKLLVARMADAVLEGKAMRKEEEPDEESPATAEMSADAKPTKLRKGKQHVVEAADVDEVGEGDLLGESTLAKLNVARKLEEKPEVVAVSPRCGNTGSRGSSRGNRAKSRSRMRRLRISRTGRVMSSHLDIEESDQWKLRQR